MNNKGFAISTLIYGLSILGIMLIMILMNTLSASRNGSKEMADVIEDELNKFSKTSVIFGVKDELQSYVVPTGESGWYRIELWGAQGASGSGGYGAYTTGVIHLDEGERLYFNIGKMGSGTNAGGGSTDVRIESTSIGEQVSLDSRIMVAAGGGTKANSHGGTLCGYGPELNSYGGQVDINNEYKLTSANLIGTLTPPESYVEDYSACKVGLNANVTKKSVTIGNQKTGDGYYISNPSSPSSDSDGYYGGISFISGYLGSQAIVKGEEKQSTPVYTHYEYSYDENGVGTYATSPTKSYYFVDGLMLPGVKTGNGKATIEKIVAQTEETTELPRKNTKLNSVKRITDCVSEPDASSNPWIEIKAISKGNIITGTLSTSENCRYIEFPTTDLDEILVRHKAGKDYSNNIIQVTHGNNSTESIKAGSGYSVTETVTGTRISAYQPDMTNEIPTTGNYYIFSVLSENTVLSAFQDALNDSNPIKFEFLVGDNRQKWSIETLTGKIANPSKNEYKIVELTRYKALAIYLDENKKDNRIAASENFNIYQRNEPQIWTITANGNGTFKIKTIVSAFTNNYNTTGNIVLFANDRGTKYADSMPAVIGIDNTTTSAIWLYSLDYSAK